MKDEELEEDLKTTSAQVSATAELVDALEEQKRNLPHGDPRVIELSDRIERLASSLRRQTAIEGDLTREIHRTATEGDAG
ncbi:MAG TPA: hypothetical protein VJ850_08095 [Candidatus Limnocylindrales bacterium]|nr:hypothetical protein [Candidatus Limnocylindrales bacterium]